MANLMQSGLNFIAKHFKEDMSKMLIFTGALGWALSSAAQMFAILINKKISEKEKSFLLPQEFYDAAINIGLFLSVTSLAKFGAKKLFTMGKFAPQSVRDYIQKNTELKKQAGKLDFNLDKIAETHAKFPTADYETYKNLSTTVTTIGAGILATNILTPIARNKAASSFQKKYEEYKKSNLYNTNYSNGMKI